MKFIKCRYFGEDYYIGGSYNISKLLNSIFDIIRNKCTAIDEREVYRSINDVVKSKIQLIQVSYFANLNMINNRSENDIKEFVSHTLARKIADELIHNKYIEIVEMDNGYQVEYKCSLAFLKGE